MILVVDKKETLLRYRAGSLLIEQTGKKTWRAPLNQLEQVIVYGNPMAETGVWRALAAAGVPTAMLAGRGKSEAAMLGSGLATQLPLRRMQYRCADNQVASIAVARRFVDIKLQSYDLPLKLLSHQFDPALDAIEAFVVQRDQGREKLQLGCDINTLMGLEGSVARAWFALLAKSLSGQWRFSGRNRRPPRDPVNALLSLGYTLMHSEVRQVLIASGFDPSLGFLHQDYPGRESLVLDFSEIFRAGIDYFVLELLHHAGLDASSFFYREADGCRLSKESRPIFFNQWAQFRDNWPRPLAQSTVADWPVSPLRELVGGQLAQLREYLKTREEGDA